MRKEARSIFGGEDDHVAGFEFDAEGSCGGFAR